MENTIEIDGIQLKFNERRILSDIYMKCCTGKITGLLGLNGQGKTCLMNIIYGTLSAEYVSVRINDIGIKNLYKKPSLMTFLPQFNFIPDSLTLKKISEDFNFHQSVFFDLFPEFEQLYNLPICKLSGGQRRLIEVYSIVQSNANFTLLDEPFTHLMPVQVEKIIKIMQDVKQRKGFIITDHLFDIVVELSDILYVLRNGKTHNVKNMKDLEQFGYIKK
jgi:ABC-type lipopolysaccharide export system ATPase subunit